MSALFDLGLGQVAFAVLALILCVAVVAFGVWSSRNQHGWRGPILVGLLIAGVFVLGLRSGLAALALVENHVATVLRSSSAFTSQVVQTFGLSAGTVDGTWQSQRFENLVKDYTKKDPVVSSMFLVRRMPDGNWTYLAKPMGDFDRDGYSSLEIEGQAKANDVMQAELAGLDEAWRGHGSLHKSSNPQGKPGFYYWSEPVNDQDGVVVAVLVVTSPQLTWKAEADDGIWSAFSVTSLMCLVLLAAGIITTQFLQSLSNLRVTKAEATLQQEQIRSHMAIIAQKNQDMAEQQSLLADAASKLRALATTDGLTGLLNHRALMDFLSAAMRGNNDFGSPCSVILLDVDNFKQLNDQYGHPAGDEALRVLAAVLAHSAPPGSAVGRYGGEEFMLVIPGASESAATAVAEELRRRIQMAKTSSRPITVSVGVSTVYSMAKSEQALLDEADRALYSSKRNGKNRVTHYGQGLLETAI